MHIMISTTSIHINMEKRVRIIQKYKLHATRESRAEKTKKEREISKVDVGISRCSRGNKAASERPTCVAKKASQQPAPVSHGSILTALLQPAALISLSRSLRRLALTHPAACLTGRRNARLIYVFYLFFFFSTGYKGRILWCTGVDGSIAGVGGIGRKHREIYFQHANLFLGKVFVCQDFGERL